MALEALGFPQYISNYGFKDLIPFAASFNMDFGDYYNSGFVFSEGKEEKTAMQVHGGQFLASPSSTLLCNTSSPSENFAGFPSSTATEPVGENAGRRKRRRTKSCKNNEEVENQRMTHIAVERNRRKQMNEYLSALRSLMPPSYVQRGDQASIVGGAINFVKELEQLLMILAAEKRMKQQHSSGGVSLPPMENLLAFSQRSSMMAAGPSRCSLPLGSVGAENNKLGGIAEVEVTLVECHANVKIVSRRRPRQLLKLAAAFQTLQLTILHLNVTAIDDVVLYSVSAKVEEGCQVASVDEIAAAMHQIMGRIHSESGLP